MLSRTFTTAQQNIWPESCAQPCANNELQVITMMAYYSVCPERLQNRIGFISEEQACSFDLQVCMYWKKNVYRDFLRENSNHFLFQICTSNFDVKFK